MSSISGVILFIADPLSFWAPWGTAEAVPYPFVLEHRSVVAQDGASPVSTRVFPQLKACPTQKPIYEQLLKFGLAVH
jgi:hypothetical protein